MAYSDLIRNRSKALRIALDNGEINLNALRNFLLIVEGGEREQTPEEVLYAKHMAMLDKKPKVKFRKQIVPQ